MTASTSTTTPTTTAPADEEKDLTLDEMLSAPDVRYDEIYVPEWKGRVYLASIDAGTMIDFVNASGGADDKKATIRLIVQSLVDRNKKRMVTDPKEVEVKTTAFLKKDVRVMNRILDKVMDLNGITVKPAILKNVLSEARPNASPIV